MKIAVVEKNVAIQEYVKAGFMTFAENAQIESFSNAKEFLEVFKENPDAFNMVLLNTDYESPGSGLTIAEKVRRLSMKVAILFVTRNADYYSEAFKVFALGYLLFPFDIRDLQNCVNFYSKNATKERRASWLLKTSDGWRRVYCRFITYVESDNREIIIHLENGQELRSYGKLNEAQQQLPADGFLRCHQSYIVNLYFIDELKSNSFYLNNIDIPISRKYLKSAKDTYYDYMFSKM